MERDRIVRAFSDYPMLFKGIRSELDIFDILKKGLPVRSLSAIESHGVVSSAELGDFISKRTLTRRKSQGRLTPEESDLVARLGRIYEFALEVFGKKEKANKWLRTPNRALRNYRPLDLVSTDYGARIVESTLGRIQHGIFS
jgi:putative toxin-antitoxin system antitoxin component (TIGR02293 family)